MELTLHMIDVFGSGPLSGNPLAVVTGAHSLSTAEMQRLTRWFNLSETTFLLPPTDPAADYSVRIFTPDREMPFAGHPTLGTCHAWLESGGIPKHEEHIVQQCGIGRVPIRRDADRLAFAAPPLIRSGAPSPQERQQALQFLGIEANDVVDAAWIDNGPGWLGIRLASADKVLALTPDRSWPQRIEIGVVAPYTSGSAIAFELRAFFSDQHGTVVEDPVTGSLNASVAQWLYATGVAHGAYIAAQGTRLGRQGRIYVDRDGGGQVWVGGTTKTVVEGHIQWM